jgi:TAT (twin-arginine translocation) pathway-exported protein
MNPIDRREFLRGSGAAALALTAPECRDLPLRAANITPSE